MLEYITEITILIIEIICYFTFFDIFAIKRKRNKISISCINILNKIMHTFFERVYYY